MKVKPYLLFLPLVMLAAGLVVVHNPESPKEAVTASSSYDPLAAQRLADHYAYLAEVGKQEAMKANKVEAAKRAAAERARAEKIRASRSRYVSVSKKASSAPSLRKVSTEPSIRSGSTREVQASGSASAWAASARTVRLRNCESGNNYRSVNASGKYRGAYQMDREFWLDHGGNPSLTPDQASKSEQDAVAYDGYKERGWTPWPQCGYV